MVSIHAPWEGCDGIVIPICQQAYRFNSRTLGRVRHARRDLGRSFTEFQFTHPGKGATISTSTSISVALFQFTHPGKGATRYSKLSDDRVKFQFTHPGKGATCVGWRSFRSRHCFNSRTLGRVRPCLLSISFQKLMVSIHAPWEGCDR